MKQRIFTLMVALLAIAVGAQNVKAEPTENLVLTMETGTPYVDDNEMSKLIGVLYLCNQLQMYENKAGKYVYASKDGKDLFTVSEAFHCYQLFPNVSETDDISYTITDADREKLQEINDLYTFIQPYKTLTLHFGEGQTDFELVGTIESGMMITEENPALIVVEFFVFVNQIKIEEDNENKRHVFLSKDGKQLFYFNKKDESITMAPGVTSEDDITYTLTEEDIEYIKSKDEEFFEFIRVYKTVTLHFIGNPTDLAGTIKTGMTAGEESPALNVVQSLIFVNQLKMEEDSENRRIVFLSKDGKELFYIDDKEDCITVASGVTSKDDIIYTLTDEDRETIKNKNEKFYEMIQPYNTLMLHFVDNKIDWLVATIKPGMSLDEKEGSQALMDIEVMIEILASTDQIKIENDKENNMTYFLSKDGKKLFSVSDDDRIIIASGVTSEDDIIYTLTAENREAIKNIDNELYEYIRPYKVLQLHFDVPEDFVAKLFTEMNLTTEINQGIYKSFTLMTYYFNQLKADYDFEKGETVVSSLDDKVLMTMTDDGVITVAPDVTIDDNINYTITQEDLDKLADADKDLYDFAASYKTIQLLFAENLEVTIKTGLPYDDQDEVFYAIGLMYLSNQLQFNEDNYYYASMEGKPLFTFFESSGDMVYRIFPGVSEADDMSYTITEEDLPKLKEMGNEYYNFFLHYKTVTVHFEAGQDNREDLVLTVKDGMEINGEDNMEWLVPYVLTILQQLKTEDDAILSMEDKLLFTVKNEHVVLAPGVTSADDINYTLTAADLVTLEKIDATLAGFLSVYKTLQLHFDVAIPGDVNGDGEFNLEDITWLISAYLSSEEGADLDGDGKLTIDDITSLIELYLQK